MIENSSDLYINRELSWLRFNSRVLYQAKNKKSPLLERLKFLAIYGTNLDEFYMIRVAGLKELFSAGIVDSGADKLTPIQQLNDIRKYIHEEKVELEKLYFELIDELKNEGVSLNFYDDLSDEQKSRANEYFFNNLYPVIIPIAVDATHPFPHLNNLSFGLAVKLQDSEKPKNIKFGLIRIPRVLPRFIELKNGAFVPIGSIVVNHINELFPGYKLLSATPFRITRNADLEIEEEEADDFLEIMQEGLRSRRKGSIVRLEIGESDDTDLIDFLNSHLKVFKDDIYSYKTPLNLGSLWQIVGNKDFVHLTLPPYKPKMLPPFSEHSSILNAIDINGEILSYQPYESFEPVVRFIQEASKDPNVLAIRMTLYRVGKDSPIVKALIDAALEGKQVTAMVELKARFDEENNLHWARALENVGAHVIYGIAGLKVHAKIALVIKKTNNGLKQYAHFSTGNYNQATAKIYTDISYFTNKDEFVNDATRFFHYLTGFSKIQELSTIAMAPTQIKPKMLALIENEEKFKDNGRIIIKANAVVDVEIIKALYKASQAGVKIDLIVRGICCLRPNVEGISENIRVVSIIGKYLEHSRIFYFKNSTPQMFFASADMMPRNLERRVELMVPIVNPKIGEKLLELLKVQINDTALAFELQSNGEYKKVEVGEIEVNSQDFMEDFINKLAQSKETQDTVAKMKKLSARLLKES
ncbi:MAG: RNA degradosome polyphosphate kinase [Campylobacterales bacterium]|nr:RNA degradosome polyphosphate kinase [Campylobacterales bacterium]